MLVHGVSVTLAPVWDLAPLCPHRWVFPRWTAPNGWNKQVSVIKTWEKGNVDVFGRPLPQSFQSPCQHVCHRAEICSWQCLMLRPFAMIQASIPGCYDGDWSPQNRIVAWTCLLCVTEPDVQNTIVFPCCSNLVDRLVLWDCRLCDVQDHCIYDKVQGVECQ